MRFPLALSPNARSGVSDDTRGSRAGAHKNCRSEPSEESGFCSRPWARHKLQRWTGPPPGTVEGFGGVAGFDGIVGFVADAGGVVAFPTVRYLRIFSRRLGPMPRIALKSSTLLNAPYDLRICKIFSAVTGPIPGTNCSSSDVAVFRLIGAVGGFFFATSPEQTAQHATTTNEIRAKDRDAIAAK